MLQIQFKNTSQDKVYLQITREIGFSGYRIHRKDLPGKPDLAWIGRKLAVFVHGCFWHGHDCTDGIRKPKTNQDYWIPKIARNQQRDTENIANLRSAGWDVIVVWECEMNDKARLTKKLQQFLSFSAPN